VTSRVPGSERRTPHVDPNLPARLDPEGTAEERRWLLRLYGVGAALVLACIALGRFVAVWVGVVVFLVVVLGRMVWVFIDSWRILGGEQAADPLQPHAHLREEWEQAASNDGRRLAEARRAKRLYEQALVRYVKQRRE